MLRCCGVGPAGCRLKMPTGRKRATPGGQGLADFKLAGSQIAKWEQMRELYKVCVCFLARACRGGGRRCAAAGSARAAKGIALQRSRP